MKDNGRTENLMEKVNNIFQELANTKGISKTD